MAITLRRNKEGRILKRSRRQRGGFFKRIKNAISGGFMGAAKGLLKDTSLLGETVGGGEKSQKYSIRDMVAKKYGGTGSERTVNAGGYKCSCKKKFDGGGRRKRYNTKNDRRSRKQ